jgi:acyl-CoA synthetase (AMP-forming)/AMP-acid ligase II
LRGGWLHTGDVGSFDEEGFLTLRDRSKDMIISGGSNIYPREIEEVLLRHPDLVEVSVVGRPHREWGEEVVAFVVARPGAEIPAGALDRLCLDHIARFKAAAPLPLCRPIAKEQLWQGAEDRVASVVERGDRVSVTTPGRPSAIAARRATDRQAARRDRRAAGTAPGVWVSAAGIC